MGRMRFRPWGRGCLMVRLLLLTATMKSEYVPLMRVRLGMAGRLDCAVFTMPRVVYCIERQTGICRKRTGRGFCYIMPDGKRVGAGGELSRIASLRIPPAWTDVWISPDAKTHLQATGRDSMGRLQYLYHAQWRSHREQLKFERLLAFARFLPAFRRRAQIDARQGGMGKQKVLAAVCNLLDRTLIRVGNDEYASQNGSYGLTTMRNRHVKIHGPSVEFSFRGKSGRHHDITLHDPVLARIVARCRELPGSELFEYFDSSGKIHDVTAPDVNRYIQEVSETAFTAKDFRTWHGTVLAAKSLQELPAFTSAREACCNLVWAGRRVAAELGNTLAVCRKSYIHPGVVESYLAGEFADIVPARISGLRVSERFTYALLQKWYARSGKRNGSARSKINPRLWRKTNPQR